jgi:hypothetical protein
LLFACTEPTDEAPPADPSACEVLGLPTRDFLDDVETGTQRRQIAADFTMPTTEGRWKLSENWSGCDSYVVITDAETLGDGDTFWTENNIGQLVRRSPPNAHYFFVSLAIGDNLTDRTDLIADHVKKALRRLDDGAEPGQRDWWTDRLHVVTRNGRDLQGWLATAIPADTPEGNPTGSGFAIDRFQRMRGIGSYADVENFNGTLDWPYEPNYAYAANEVQYFEFEAARQARLDAEDVTVVSAWSGEILEEFAETDVPFPTREELAAFDTLEIDLSAFCPNPGAYEAGNCGAWDYLAHLRLLDEDGETWHEFARFITTYHRAGRYLVDATPLLALLGDGGMRTIRYNFAPSWNTQPTETWLDFRFSNQGKGYRPTDITPLWSDRGFNSAYNTDLPTFDVPVSDGAAHVELWALITGHGGATNNCAEFCNHQHEFTVSGLTDLYEFPDVGNDVACRDRVSEGVIPNQYGTWWFGRGGWCPGQEVDPYVLDVTAEAAGAASLSYRGLYEGGTPPDDAGNISMTSYLVVYE